MNEKTKRILRYVACGLGGLALGIGLLGGLAMCASSGNRSTSESVNTILTKKNSIITNPTNNITSYTFDLETKWNLQTTDTATAEWYDFDTTTYQPTLLTGSTSTISVSNYASLVSYISNTYESQSVPSGKIYFLAIWARSSSLLNYGSQAWYYFSFKLGSSTYSLTKKPMIETNLDPNLRISLLVYTALTGPGRQLDVPIIPYEENDSIGLKDVPSSNTTAKFVDIESYYKAQGWSSGYESGENAGYWAGYNEGIGTASSFTDISGNLNAVYDLTTMGILSPTWQNLHGLTDVKIHTLLQFFDNDQNSWDCYIVDGVSSTQPTGTRTMYVDVAQLSSLDSQTIGFAIYKNASNVGLQEVGTAHFEFAQIRNVNNKSLAKKLVLLYGWTQNDVSYQAGYQAGLKDGFENTNTNNVFSLFTSAFNAVGGFFNLKIFGFLPLYWFFLTPLFVAIITLLLRMVKH